MPPCSRWRACCRGSRAAFRRGSGICFWSGHSHGRYAGSTWYADTHWDELNRRCVAHVNVDSTGGVGASMLADAPRLGGVAAARPRGGAGAGRAGPGGRRMSRAGDQSFWGIGLPAMYMTMSEQPADGQVDAMASSLARGRKSAGLGWWWHTPHDTLDKIDPANLVRDTRVYRAYAVAAADRRSAAARLSPDRRRPRGGTRPLAVTGRALRLSALLGRVEALAAAVAGLGGTRDGSTRR